MGPWPSGGQSASLPLLAPPPQSPASPPLSRPTWSRPPAPGSSLVQVPYSVAFSTQWRGGGLFPSCFRPHVADRSEVPAELSEAQDGAGGAVGAALPSSRPISVIASGREMVVLSVPAEVTVILLDIEGTTTPIAFVKVRG